MKKAFRFIAMFLATMMVLTSFTFIALAEGEDASSTDPSAVSGDPSGESSAPSDESSNPGGESSNPGGESSNPGGECSNPGGESSNPGGESSNPGGESSNPGGESSNPGGESSNPGGESSNPGGDDPKPTDKYTIKVICSEPNGISEILIGGTSVSAGGSVSLSGDVFISVAAKSGYNISRAVIMAADEEILELDYSPDGTAEATVANLTNGVTYTLEINLVPFAPSGETNINISTDDGGSGKLLGYDILVNGVPYSGDVSSFSVNRGDRVTITLNTAEAFEVKRCLFYFNNAYVSKDMNGNSYEFIAVDETVNIKIYYYRAPIKLTANGPVRMEVYFHTDLSPTATFENTTVGRAEKTVYVEIYDRAEDEDNAQCYYVKSYAVEGKAYELDGIATVSGTSDNWRLGPARYFVVDGLITVTQSVKEKEVPIEPTEHTVTVIVGEGGSVTAVRKSDGKTFTFDSKNKTVKLTAGDSLDFTFVPADGYVIDTIYDNDESVTLENGESYSITGIIADHRIEAKFISEEELLKNGIGDDDVNWDADNIIIDVTSETPVLPEVFQHIAKLSGSGKYVEFRSENGSIFVPYGKESVVGASTNMAIGVLPDPSGLAALLAADAKYKVLSVSAGAILPEGTKISVKLGKDFASENIMLYEYKGTSLAAKETQLVGANGVSPKYSYNNETTIVFANRQFEVSISSNGGGAITPYGDQIYIDGTKLKVELSASEGYVIESIKINGQLREIDENLTEYTLPIIVSESYAIDIKFALKEGADVDESGDASDDSKDDDGGSDGFNPVPVLIIAFVAVSGAAALFIVKWKQEKF